MKNRIICIGNRLLPEDAAGSAVFDYLQRIGVPENIDVIEGGTAGLNLLPLLEQGGRIVFIDAVSGFTDEGDIIVLDQAALTQSDCNPSFGHDIGLPFVLSVLPRVCDGHMPEKIFIVGLEGKCDTLAIEKAAKIGISLAANTM